MKRYSVWAAVFSMFLALWVATPAQAASTPIVSEGPLTQIRIGDDLNCAVNHEADRLGEWYAEWACGTFVALDGKLYGPNNIPAGGSVTGSSGYQAFTPVSQALTGSGTAASPFRIVTIVELGDTGVRLEETDSYVVGEERYRTDVKLISSPNSSASATVYRAGDCYLQDDDAGLGKLLNGNSPTCLAKPGSSSPNRVQGLAPLTGGSSYMESYYSDVWRAVGSQDPLPNTIYSTTEVHDNAVGLSWSFVAPAGGSRTLSSYAFFSPVGDAPLGMNKTADASTVAPGGQVGYTITVTNEGVRDMVLSSIVDTLPSGFSYVPGTTTGVTTTDPSVSGQGITWSGSFTVPAATQDGPGSVSLTFRATVSSETGTYYNTVDGTCVECSVVGAPGVAPVIVGDDATPEPTVTPTATPTATPTVTPTMTPTPTGTSSPSQSPSSSPSTPNKIIQSG